MALANKANKVTTMRTFRVCLVLLLGEKVRSVNFTENIAMITPSGQHFVLLTDGHIHCKVGIVV